MGSLSDIQQQIILGCVLGDGYMRKKTNAHLQITHSIKQKEYVDWKYLMLKNITSSAPKVYLGNEGRIGYRFFTRSIPELTEIYQKYYQSSEKVVTNITYLSPIVLAVWYMDDGSKSYRSCYFNCQKFNRFSQMNLIKSLERLGLQTALNKDKKYTRIRVRTSSTPRLMDLIKPYVIESMRYKIPV